MQGKSLLENYLTYINNSQKFAMNAIPSYTRLFPMFLGSSSARLDCLETVEGNVQFLSEHCLQQMLMFSFTLTRVIHWKISIKFLPQGPNDAMPSMGNDQRANNLSGMSSARSLKSILKLTASFWSQYPNTGQSRKTHDDSSDSAIQSNLKNNPYYEKYAEKIEKLKNTNPTKYSKRLSALESIHSTPQKVESVSEDTVEKQQTTSDTMSANISDAKSLDSILNVDKVKVLSTDNIRRLWIEHYSSKDAVCAVIPSAAYRNIYEIAILYPVFIYPVPRQDGYEMFVGQFSDDEFHFTSLVNYQRHQENAVSQLTLKHYRELEKEKGIVLMSGHVLDGLSVTDAQLLSYLVQHFYTEHVDLIKQFNHSPNTFNVENVISAMDKTLLMKAGKLSQI